MWKLNFPRVFVPQAIVDFISQYDTFNDFLKDTPTSLTVGGIIVAIFLSIFIVWRIVVDDLQSRTDTWTSPENAAAEEREMKRLVEMQENRYRSGKTDTYNWIQNEEEFELRFPVSETIKTRDVQMSVKPTSFLFKIQGKDYIQGTFLEEVAPGDCIWQFDGEGTSRHIEIMIRKRKETKPEAFWECPLVEAVIDTTKQAGAKKND